MSLQSADMQSRKAESLPHLRPITETCDVDRMDAILDEERARLGHDEAWHWKQVAEAFDGWLGSVRPDNAMILRAALSSLRTFAARGGE